MQPRKLIVSLITGALCQFALCTGYAQNNPSPPAETRRGPGDIICEKIQHEVARKMSDIGASYDQLTVKVAINRDSSTPFKAVYKGLRNFPSADGIAPDSDGEFRLDYIGGGQWQGKLHGIQFTVAVGTTDNIDLPFVNDPDVLGEWESVDFVPTPEAFTPDNAAWKGKLFLRGLTFLPDGKTHQPWWTWTKGSVMHHGDKTASKYEIREISGKAYLFFEWKSGDVTIAGMPPKYYVLQKKAPSTAQ